MRLFGEPVPAALPQVIGRVGAIVEQPKFFPNFSGRQNLRAAAPARSASTGDGRVDEVPRRRSGSRGRGRDRFKGLLPRHEAAARRSPRRCSRSPRPADPRRADQRARPGRHPRDPRHDPRPRRDGRDGPARAPHPRRGAAGLRLGDDHRPRPAAGRRTRSTTCSGPTPYRGTRVRLADLDAGESALTGAGSRCTRENAHLLVDGSDRARRDHRAAGAAGPLRRELEPGPRRPRDGLPRSSPPTKSRESRRVDRAPAGHAGPAHQSPGVRGADAVRRAGRGHRRGQLHPRPRSPRPARWQLPPSSRSGARTSATSYQPARCEAGRRPVPGTASSCQDIVPTADDYRYTPRMDPGDGSLGDVVVPMLLAWPSPPCCWRCEPMSAPS